MHIDLRGGLWCKLIIWLSSCGDFIVVRTLTQPGRLAHSWVPSSSSGYDTNLITHLLNDKSDRNTCLVNFFAHLLLMFPGTWRPVRRSAILVREAYSTACCIDTDALRETGITREESQLKRSTFLSLGSWRAIMTGRNQIRAPLCVSVIPNAVNPAMTKYVTVKSMSYTYSVCALKIVLKFTCAPKPRLI